MLLNEIIDQYKLIIESPLDKESVQRDLNAMSEEEQIAAVQENFHNIMLIKNPSEAVQLAAVEDYGAIIKHIKNPTEAVQIAAVKDYGPAIAYINNPSYNVQLAAVNYDGVAIAGIANPLPEIQLAAVETTLTAIEYITYPSEAVQLYVLRNYPELIHNIHNPTRLNHPDIKELILKPILAFIRRNWYKIDEIEIYQKLYPEWPEWESIFKSLRSTSNRL